MKSSNGIEKNPEEEKAEGEEDRHNEVYWCIFLAGNLLLYVPSTMNECSCVLETGKIPFPFLGTAPLQYVSKWLFTQAMANWVTINTV